MADKAVHIYHEADKEASKLINEFGAEALKDGKWLIGKLGGLSKYGKFFVSPKFKKYAIAGGKYAWEATRFMVKWCPRITKVMSIGSKIISFLQPELAPELWTVSKVVRIGCKALGFFAMTPIYTDLKKIAAKKGW